MLILYQIEDQHIFSQKIEMFNFCLQTTKYMPDDDDVQVFHAFMLKFDIRLLINREQTRIEADADDLARKIQVINIEKHGKKSIFRQKQS